MSLLNSERLRKIYNDRGLRRIKKENKVYSQLEDKIKFEVIAISVFWLLLRGVKMKLVCKSVKREQKKNLSIQ